MLEFGDLAMADLSELQSRLGTTVTDVRRLEGRKCQLGQRCQQLAREELELERELRRMGLDPTPTVGRGTGAPLTRYPMVGRGMGAP